MRRTVAAHGDGVGYTDGVELPAEHALFFDGSLNDLAEFEYYRGCVLVSLLMHKSDVCLMFFLSTLDEMEWSSMSSTHNAYYNTQVSLQNSQ